MNNNVMGKNNKTKIIILIVSWALAVTFIVIGMVSLLVKPVPELELGVIRYDDVEYYSGYTYEFTPESTQTYYLKLDNAELQGVTSNEYSYVSYTSVSSTSYYDKMYRMTLTEGVTYNFSIYTQDYDYIRIVISTRNN